MATNKGKNIGEWSEMYIFFKLMSDRKVYVADKDMNRLKDVFLNIISMDNQLFYGAFSRKRSYGNKP